MKVTVTPLANELGSKGMVFYIADTKGRHVGKFRVGMAKVEWCQGKVPLGSGRTISLQAFITDHLEKI